MEKLSNLIVAVKYGLYVLVFASAIVLATHAPTEAASLDTTSITSVSHQYTMDIQGYCNDNIDCYYVHCRYDCNPIINWPQCECSYWNGACFADAGGYCSSSGGGGEGGGPEPE